MQTYPFGIFGSTIISTLNPNDSLTQTIGYGTVLNCFYLPGTLIGGLLMDKIGRKQTMTLGFVLWAILGYIIGGAFENILPIFPLFVVLYGIFNTLGEMGPGVSINVIKPYISETLTIFSGCHLFVRCRIIPYSYPRPLPRSRCRSRQGWRSYRHSSIYPHPGQFGRRQCWCSWRLSHRSNFRTSRRCYLLVLDPRQKPRLGERGHFVPRVSYHERIRWRLWRAKANFVD